MPTGKQKPLRFAPLVGSRGHASGTGPPTHTGCPGVHPVPHGHLLILAGRRWAPTRLAEGTDYAGVHEAHLSRHVAAPQGRRRRPGPGCTLMGWGRHSCLLSPCQGGPKPWGQAGKMTFLAESDRGWLPTQRKRKFYGRKLDLKSNQAPGKRTGQRGQLSGWAGGREARSQVGEIVPSSRLRREPGLLFHCWGKDRDPRARQAMRTERHIFANMSPRA